MSGQYLYLTPITCHFLSARFSYQHSLSTRPTTRTHGVAAGSGKR